MYVVCIVFFFKQKTAYEMRISDWSSDVCSSDLRNACSARSLCLFAAAPENQWIAALQPHHVAPGPSFPHQERVDRILRHSVPCASLGDRKIGRASCRERVCQYV